MNKIKKIQSKKKTSSSTLFIFLICISFYFYLIFFKLYDLLSVKTGICETCSGPLKLINNPLPGLIWGILAIITARTLSKIFK